MNFKKKNIAFLCLMLILSVLMTPVSAMALDPGRVINVTVNHYVDNELRETESQQVNENYDFKKDVIEWSGEYSGQLNKVEIIELNRWLTVRHIRTQNPGGSRNTRLEELFRIDENQMNGNTLTVQPGSYATDWEYIGYNNKENGEDVEPNDGDIISDTLESGKTASFPLAATNILNLYYRSLPTLITTITSGLPSDVSKITVITESDLDKHIYTFNPAKGYIINMHYNTVGDYATTFTAIFNATEGAFDVNDEFEMTVSNNLSEPYTDLELDAGKKILTVNEIQEGDIVTAPAPAPVNSGKTFTGWYLTVAGIQTDKEWDFEKEITTNIELHAKWKPNGTTPGGNNTTNPEVPKEESPSSPPSPDPEPEAEPFNEAVSDGYGAIIFPLFLLFLILAAAVGSTLYMRYRRRGIQ